LEQPLIPVPRAPVSRAPSRPGTRLQARQTRLTTHRWRLLLLAGWLFQAGFRAWLGRGLDVPLANPDETAYLIAARVLAGGAGANLTHSTLYPAGYPLLISPVFWFTQNPQVAYHAVLLVNAMFSALLMPLAYVACQRLGLTSRPLAYGVAMVTALLPAGLLYSEFAMSDAIFPVLVLAWLLTTHSWLTASTHRNRMLAAAGSALLAGYSYSVHSRGLVLIAGYLVVLLIMVLWKKCRDSAIAASFVLVVTLLTAWALNQRLKATMYPEGARSFYAEATARLGNLHGIVLVLEMAIGQMWRFALDSWGVAALGMAAVVVAIARSRTPADARIIAGLAVAVTLAIAITTPAALPADQPQQWASGRYLDCMIITFFLPGMVVLLRAGRRRLLIYAACVVPPTMITALVVDAYATSSVPTLGFGAAFNFGEPAFLTQNWTQANVALATAVALGLLAAFVAIAAMLPGGSRAIALLAGLAAVSVAADVDMTSQIGNANQALGRAFAVEPLAGLRPGEQIGISNALGWQLWIPQAYELSWSSQVFFTPSEQAPPDGVKVVEVPWIAGQSEQATWPNAPSGWHITSASQTAGWVVWQTASS
jgi:hypothetical protein